MFTRKAYRLLCLLVVWTMILPGGGRPAASAAPDELTFTLETPPYQNVIDPQGRTRIEIEGFRPAGSPGAPALPSRVYEVALPPDADLGSVSVEVVRSKTVYLAGAIDLDITPPAVASYAGQKVVAWEEAPSFIEDGKAALRPALQTLAPGGTVALASTGQMRKWRFASLVYTPLQYDLAGGPPRLATEVQVRVTYRRQALPAAQRRAALRDTVMDERAAGLFHNYAQARGWYAPGGRSAQAAGSSDYVIITTNAIQAGSARLGSFVAHKQAQGHTVEVITETQWGGMTGQFPNDSADKIRKWLKDNYLVKGIQYVLLIGDPDPDDPRYTSGDHIGDVIQKLAWPRRGSTTDPYEDSPTDYYYADLTGNWDLDGDGYYGEYNGDRGAGGVDFANELYVGRISVFNNDPSGISTLDSILQKIINYENSGSVSWRRSALLPMTFSADITDGAFLSERMKNDYLNGQGYSAYTLYQYTGAGCYSEFSSDEPLVDGAVLAEWKAHDYGIVSWWAHGNPDGVMIGYGNSGQPCREEGTLLYKTDVAELDDAHPAIVFAGSCYGIDPTSPDGLGYSLLTRGAVMMVSATALSFYEDGDWAPHPELADTATIGYYFIQHIASDGWNAGRSLYDTLKWLSTQGLTWGKESWINLMTFNLLGDPTTGIGLAPAPGTPTNLTATAAGTSLVNLAWTDNSSDETGFKVERSLNGASGWTQLATTGANVNTFIDTGLACGARYYYRVRSFNGISDSAYSNTASATTVYCACSASTPTPLACGGSITGSNNAAGSTDLIDKYSCSASDMSGPEYIYPFTLATSGQVTVSLSGMTANLDLFVLDNTSGTCSAGNCVSTGDTSATFSAAGGQTYYLSVDGVNGAVSGYTLSVTCEEPPPVPTGLAATPVSISQINLSWMDSGATELGYRIQQSADGVNNWGELAQTAANVTTYSHTNLVDNTTYFYRVIAFNDSGSSAPSNTASATTPLEPPASLAAVAASQTLVNLTWTDNTNNEVGFRVERCLGSSCSNYVEIGSAGQNATGFADASAAADSTYSYRVRAYYGANYSGYSGKASTTTPPYAPAAPGGLDAVASSDDQIDLTWTDNSSNESGFRIERSLDGATSWTQAGANSANDTTFSNSGLADYTLYYYRVLAYNSGGSSQPSNLASATTELGQPTNLTATAVSQARIDLAWKDNSSKESGYQIERCQGQNCAGFVQVGAVGSSATSYNVTALASDTPYTFRVRATAGGVASDYSNTAWAATLPNPPLAPGGLVVSLDSGAPQSQLNLTWTDTITNETGFKIERCSGSGCSNFIQIDLVAANTIQYQDNDHTAGLLADTFYSYRLRATNAGGDSLYSNTAGALTKPYTANAPTGLTATLASGPRIDLAWTDNSANETGFILEQSLAGTGNWTVIYTTTADVSVYPVTGGLVEDTIYAFRVKAYNASGTSGYTNTASAATLPKAPAGLSAAAESPFEIRLAWTDTSQTESGFKVERSLDGTGGWTLAGTAGMNATSFADPSRSPGTTYYYRVYAHHTGGSSAYSSVASAATPSSRPDAPADLSAALLTQNELKVHLSWQDHSGNETRFELGRSQDGGQSWAQLAPALAANTTEYVDASISADKLYFYRVRACGGYDCSDWSAATGAWTARPPELALEALSTSQLKLFWYDNSAGEDGYRVERSPDGATGWSEVVAFTANPTTSMNFIDAGLICSHAYSYRVYALRTYAQTTFTSYSETLSAATLPCVQEPQGWELFLPLLNR